MFIEDKPQSAEVSKWFSRKEI